ncbi:MAG: aldehyde dehydrogenase EutE [Spirochaetota bacterium]|nr:aldehyde dehydrogenase EutE [Spirochaetota bacterium]
MNISENQINSIVEQVIKQIKGNNKNEHNKLASSCSTSTKEIGSYSNADHAIKAAYKAHDALLDLGLKKRDDIITAIRHRVRANIEYLSRLAVEETGLGNIPDKIQKNRLVANKTPGTEILRSNSYSDDHGLMIMERAAYGVIASITPCTNPSETIINNSIGMIAGGNSVVFNPHPTAKKTSIETVRILNEAILSVGGPENLVTTISDPTIESANELMKHPDVRLLVVTGGPAVVKVAMNSGKKVIAAGPGNPPVIVDETADIELAAKGIVNGASFDNNIICTCEKEIIVVDSIASSLKQVMKNYGAYELKGQQIKRVTDLIMLDEGKPGCAGHVKKEFVGKSARYILEKANIDVDDTVKLAIMDVPSDHPLVWTEQLMPIMPLVRVSNVDDAIDFAIKVEQNNRHTAVMYSQNVTKLSKMARLVNASIFVKNGPHYSGLGFDGPGYTSFTIASPTGEGLTTALNFTRERRCSLIDGFRIV